MRKAMQILVFFLVPALSTFAFGGEISEGAYYNKFVSLRFPVPLGWYVAADIEVTQLVKEGAQVMGLDSPPAKAMIAQTSGKVLLVVSEHRIGSNFQGFNRNMSVVAIDVRGHGDEVRTGEDYCKLAAEGIKESQPNAVISEITSQRLGGEDFHKFDVRLPIQGITTYQRQLARIANDYVVIINMSAQDPGGLEELSRLVDSMRFTPVSQAVDGSPEGQSFREQAAFKIAKRVPTALGRLLQVAGIIGMVAGFLLLLRVNPILAIIIGGALFYFFVLRR